MKLVGARHALLLPFHSVELQSGVSNDLETEIAYIHIVKN